MFLLLQGKAERFILVAKTVTGLTLFLPDNLYATTHVPFIWNKVYEVSKPSLLVAQLLRNVTLTYLFNYSKILVYVNCNQRTGVPCLIW